jgi:hypothetical protein
MLSLKIGVARVDYTPALGLPLMGNFRDDYGARGIHDPLYSRALVFQDSAGTKVALLSLDICMIDRNNASLMRRFIASQTDLRPENIIIAATHTHSGPAAMSLGSLPKSDDAAIERFLTQTVAAYLRHDRGEPGLLQPSVALQGRQNAHVLGRTRPGVCHRTAGAD